MNEQSGGGQDEGAIERTILSLVTARGCSASICPSEVARALAGPEQWRALMGPVRQAAVRLAEAGRIEVLRKGRQVSGEEVRGVIRLRVATGR